MSCGVYPRYKSGPNFYGTCQPYPRLTEENLSYAESIDTTTQPESNSHQ